MGLGKYIHYQNNFSDSKIFNDEEIALFSTITAAYENNEDDFIKILNYYKDRYNLSNLQYELFISSHITGTIPIQKPDNSLNLSLGNLRVKIYKDTGLKIGITSLQTNNNLTIFVGISGYQPIQTADARTVLITEAKGVLQGQVIQAVSIINQFYSQVIKKKVGNVESVNWVFGGHSLGGNVVQSVAAILSLKKKEFSTQYSIVNSNEFNKKEEIIASKIYTFNTLKPKVFLDSEFNFLKEKTVNYIIDNDWLLKVVKSTGGSYIGIVKLYEKLENNQGEYYFKSMDDTGNIPVNVREECISRGKVRYIEFKDIIKQSSIKLVGKYVTQHLKLPVTYYKCFMYIVYLLRQKRDWKNKEHGVYNFIANKYDKGNNT